MDALDAYATFWSTKSPRAEAAGFWSVRVAGASPRSVLRSAPNTARNVCSTSPDASSLFPHNHLVYRISADPIINTNDVTSTVT